MTREWLIRKLVGPEHVAELVETLRKEHLSTATLNGSFDLMHAGHLFIIHEAAQQADRLIVALNSDQSIRRYKGPERPIIPLQYRLEMMAALEFVDYVIWFDQTDPRALLTKIKPDVHVNGSEYGEECIEAETVKKFGGKILLVKRIPALATSEILKKVKTCV